MTRRHLKLKEFEEIEITGDNSGILIKNVGNDFSISKLTTYKTENVKIQNLSLGDLNNFTLIKFLENSIAESEKANTKRNRQLINKLLDSYYNIICGDKYETDDIKRIEFQSITYFNEK